MARRFTSTRRRPVTTEGQSRCFAEVDGYPLTVSFRWQAAYRVGANQWIDIGPVVPFATLAYPVDEIVARIETTG